MSDNSISKDLAKVADGPDSIGAGQFRQSDVIKDNATAGCCGISLNALEDVTELFISVQCHMGEFPVVVIVSCAKYKEALDQVKEKEVPLYTLFKFC